MKYVVKPNDAALAATLARVNACDGLPFRVFTASSDMRRLLTTAGLTDLPKDPKTIKYLAKLF